MSWQHVKARDELIAGFSRAAARGRLAHAYLFAGPNGVGKTLFALELAKALLCESPPANRLEACDHCAACKLVDARTHPDLFTIGRPEDKQDLPIEVVRQLCANLALKPARGRRKVAVVEDADDFNDQSANCFLKTLEEPPPGSLLILIATSAELQLPTIRSRCQTVRFGPLPEETVRDLLGKVEGLDSDAVSRLSRLAEGSVGRARALAEPEMWTLRDRLFRALSAEKEGPTAARALREWVEAAGKDSGAQRRRASAFIGLVADGLREALALSLTNSAAESSADAAVRAVAKLGPDDLLRRLGRCLEADMQVDRRVQLVLVIEGLVDGLVHRPP